MKAWTINGCFYTRFIPSNYILLPISDKPNLIMGPGGFSVEEAYHVISKTGPIETYLKDVSKSGAGQYWVYPHQYFYPHQCEFDVWKKFRTYTLLSFVLLLRVWGLAKSCLVSFYVNSPWFSSIARTVRLSPFSTVFHLFSHEAFRLTIYHEHPCKKYFSSRCTAMLFEARKTEKSIVNLNRKFLSRIKSNFFSFRHQTRPHGQR